MVGLSLTFGKIFQLMLTYLNFSILVVIMVEAVKLDEIDLQILDLLLQNAKMTSKQIAKSIRVPLTTVHNRIKKLEENGIIEKYCIKVNQERIGRGVPALIFITFSLSQKSEKSVDLNQLAERILAMPQCEELMFLTGEFDALLKVNASSISDLSLFVTEKLRSIFGIDKTMTAIVLKDFVR